jgi:hypothetical protein
MKQNQDIIERGGRLYQYDADFDIYRAVPEPASVRDVVAPVIVLAVLLIVSLIVYCLPHYPRLV